MINNIKTYWRLLHAKRNWLLASRDYGRLSDIDYELAILEWHMKEATKELKEDLSKLIGKRIVDVRLDTIDPLSGFDLVFDDGTVLELYFLGRKWAYCISREDEK